MPPEVRATVTIQFEVSSSSMENIRGAVESYVAQENTYGETVLNSTRFHDWKIISVDKTI